MLIGSLPVKLSGVACEGDEATLLDCPSRADNRQCGFETPGKTDATVVACANTDGAAGPPLHAQ